MKKCIFLCVALLACTLALAQDLTDTVRVAAPVDSTLLGKDILTVIGSGVQVNQSAALRKAFDRYVAANPSKSLQGYRIRVFLASDQTARFRSESIAASLAAAYPDLGVYRTFETPNFKVSVGDFRTKDEALKVYNELKAQYPAALLIKENINYPR